MPCFRDPDNLVYGKSEHGGILFGGYEGDPHARWIDGVPWEHGSRSLPPDQERFEPLMRGAIRRFPFLEGAEVVALVCHPDAMTPDANASARPDTRHPRPLRRRGPVPERVRWGGWHRQGDRRVDHGWRDGARPDLVPGVALRSRAPATRSSPPSRRGRPIGTTTCCDTRSIRTSGAGRSGSRPCYSRLQDLGCVFGVKNGWERPDYFRPGGAWRRAGAEQRAFGWATATVVRAAPRGARGVPGAGWDHRPVLVRQDRGRRRWSVGPPRAGLRQPDRPTGWQRRLHPIPGRTGRHRRRRHGDEAVRESVPRDHRLGRGGRRPGLAPHA